MNEPKLIVFSGLPRSGKTSLCQYLENELQFQHICSDAIREEYGIMFGSNDPREFSVNHVVRCRIMENLLMGRDVAVDTTGMFVSQRQLFLDLRVVALNKLIKVRAQRTIISLNVEMEIWEQRQKSAGRDIQQKEFFVNKFEPITPKEIEQIDHYLEFDNNTTTDLSHIKQELAKAFDNKEKS